MLAKVILALALQLLGGIQAESLSTVTDIQGISCTCAEQLANINSQLEGLRQEMSRLSHLQELDQKVEGIFNQTQGINSQLSSVNTRLSGVVDKLESIPPGSFLNPAPSCKFIPQGSLSGDYWIKNARTGYAKLEYCDMTRRCCNSTGGWMRVAHLDMTDPNQHCPSGFSLSITSPKRTCGTQGRGCLSTMFSLDGVNYSRVCGKVLGYQYFTPDAFLYTFNNRSTTIDGLYVDGVSLTYGNNPRKHIWTFAAAVDETQYGSSVCPCTRTDVSYTGHVPTFIGQDYFCDSGSRYHYQRRFYSRDPLWDGSGCGSTSSCCGFNNPPWFCKQLPQPTTDDIEMRLCVDESLSNEDVSIETIEIYVQ